MKIVATVTTVQPERAACLAYVTDALRLHLPGVDVHLVPRTAAGPREELPRAFAAVAALAPAWHLYVEDDAAFCPDFGRRALALLGDAFDEGTSAVTFYASRAADVGAPGPWRWQPARVFCMAQCVALRGILAGSVAQWLPGWYARHPEHRHAIDLALAEYLSTHGLRVRAAVPSLVQHRAVPSTLGHRGGARWSSPSYRAAFGEVDPL